MKTRGGGGARNALRFAAAGRRRETTHRIGAVRLLVQFESPEARKDGAGESERFFGSAPRASESARRGRQSRHTPSTNISGIGRTDVEASLREEGG